MALVRGGITVKPHVQRFVDDAEEYLGVKLSVGTYPGHSPPEGPTQAVDIFNTVNPAGWALQDKLCRFFIENVEKYGGRYCIRRAQIWNVERKNEGWRNQSRTGNVTVDHDDHGHFTFYATGKVGVNQPGKPSTPGKPSIPDKVKEMRDMVGLFGVLDGDKAGQVWLYDAPGRKFAYVGNPSVQRVMEKWGVAYGGDYGKEVWEYFSRLAEAGGFTGEEGEE